MGKYKEVLNYIGLPVIAATFLTLIGFFANDGMNFFVINEFFSSLIYCTIIFALIDYAVGAVGSVVCLFKSRG